MLFLLFQLLPTGLSEICHDSPIANIIKMDSLFCHSKYFIIWKQSISLTFPYIVFDIFFSIFLDLFLHLPLLQSDRWLFTVPEPWLMLGHFPAFSQTVPSASAPHLSHSMCSSCSIYIAYQLKRYYHLLKDRSWSSLLRSLLLWACIALVWHLPRGLILIRSEWSLWYLKFLSHKF